MTETIAYIDKRHALDIGIDEGFTADDGTIYDAVLDALQWGERGPLESDTSKLQLVSYVLLWRPGELFLTRRLEGGSEERLHGQVSCGVGGHVEKEDHVNALGSTYPGHEVDALEFGAWREVHEETDTRGHRRRDCGCMALQRHGFIYDPSTDVGSVHAGAVYTLRVDDCTVREVDTLEGLWVSRRGLRQMDNGRLGLAVWQTDEGEYTRLYTDDLESWARIAIAHLDELLPDLEEAAYG